MDVKTVCLGMLTDGAASGYDLKKQFESSFAHFFAAGYGSIYPALSSLADKGLVSCEQVPQEGKPDRKVYEITDDGKAFLLKCECFTKMISDIQTNCTDDWPPGMNFVAGFGQAMIDAMKKYVEENRHLFAEEQRSKSATG